MAAESSFVVDDAVATMRNAAGKIRELRELLRRTDEFLSNQEIILHSNNDSPIELRRLRKLRAEIAEEL